MNKHVAAPVETLFTDRQAVVLDAALALLVAGGEKAITTARIAKTANCSKESLYKWFGDRDGILSAMITHQASKVRVPAGAVAVKRPMDAYIEDFHAFGDDLLAVLSGPTSLALNRLAIGHANAQSSPLGDLLVDRGRAMVRERAKSLLERAQLSGHLRFDDVSLATDTLYGLLVGDGHIRLLLGEPVDYMSDAEQRRAHVARATRQFFALFDVRPPLDTVSTNT